MNKTSTGFTLIELLIVIAMMGILVSISIPSYKHYIERARFAEVMMDTAPFKTAVSVALQEGASMESLNTGENGIPPSPKPTKNVKSIAVDQGVITALATQEAGSYTYILTPDANGVYWTVSGTCLKAGLCKN